MYDIINQIQIEYCGKRICQILEHYGLKAEYKATAKKKVSKKIMTSVPNYVIANIKIYVEGLVYDYDIGVSATVGSIIYNLSKKILKNLNIDYEIETNK